MKRNYQEADSRQLKVESREKQKTKIRGSRGFCEWRLDGIKSRVFGEEGAGAGGEGAGSGVHQAKQAEAGE